MEAHDNDLCNKLALNYPRKTMFKKYLVLTFRFIWHNKVYSAINIIGFAIGITACLMIMLWVRDEMSFDSFHHQSQRIYRILSGDNVRLQPRTPHPLAQQMALDFPEVEKAVTMSPLWGPGLTRAEFSVQYEDIVYDEKGFFSVDTTFFEVFDFPFLAGNPGTALHEPMCLVLTRGMALKYFGSVEKAMGKVLRVNEDNYFTVNGVVEDVPKNSHFTFDFLISYVTMKQIDRQRNNGQLSPYYTWEDFGHYNYIVLRDKSEAETVEQKLNDWLLHQQFIPISEKDRQRIIEEGFHFELQPMRSIHLHSNIIWELGTNGNILYVYIFSTAALLILLIACINFMNLSTARSMKRAKEVGVRKTLGVQRYQLVIQFLTESVIMTMLSSAIALVLIEWLMPAFNNFTGKALSAGTLLQLNNMWMLLAGIVVIGFFSGSYPAFYLSSFIPYEVLKGKSKSGSSQLFTRKVLVIFQFSISISLIIGTLVIYKQIAFLRNRDLGFDQEQVVVVTMKDGAIRSQYDAIRASLMNNPDIINVAAASSVPGGQFNQNSIRFDEVDEERNVMETFVTADYFDLLGIKTREGRVFSDDFRGDTTASFVINEAAARLFNWGDTPLDKTITYDGDIYTNATGKIIGVVKDFNIHSLQQPVEPLIILLGRKQLFTYTLIKIRPAHVQGTLAFIENTWKKFDNRHVFTWSFLDEEFESQYQGERRMGTIFWIFALLAVFIASLGLFGLSNFMIEQRTKEIGIRKVHGAGIFNILGLLARQFAAWVIIASVIALPVGYYFSRSWLQNFAYRTPIGMLIFVVAVILAIVVTFITISYQSWQTARMEPVESLKYE
jgi:putative ABC transport system permease protein